MDYLPFHPNKVGFNTTRMENIKGLYKNLENGTQLWDVSNAIMVILLWILIVYLIIIGLSQLASYKKVKDNWEQYRCSPSIIPFASFYGFNATDNFNFCLGKIFNTHASPAVSSFTSMFGSLASVLTILISSLNSMRLAVGTLGGGINVIFQEFADRIRGMFMALRVSSIRIKNLMTRLYTTFFSIIYIALSAITGVQNFGNTVLFRFLDTFCFAPETKIHVKGKGFVECKNISIGDILLPGNERITSTFKFISDGQPMVELPRKDGSLSPIIVSTNHYIIHNNHPLRAEIHPDARPISPWNGGVDRPLICFNTDKHTITFGGYTFMDYDETSLGDHETMVNLQEQVNGLGSGSGIHKFLPDEYSPAIDPETRIILQDGRRFPAANIILGDNLSTGSQIVGVITKEINEISQTPSGKIIGSATLVWDSWSQSWKRAKELWGFQRLGEPKVFRSFICTPNSQLELATDPPIRIRDYLEVCSPDSEKAYKNALEQKTESIYKEIIVI